ncbi:multidrug effflux MFS transporter [Zymobacter sp. IVIA_5232.4 C2]|uniref:multidrug effflux MFS transporter n=1 Tax=Zymobacter sp. IVIA_5232.4 C2 TaxID=3394855 RepID=UPI0039C15084
MTSAQKTRYVVMLGLLTMFGPLCMDLYLPSLPQVSKDLDTTVTLTQLSLTTCLLGLGLGQLLIGPLSDRLGRRRPLLWALGLFTLASLACTRVTSIEQLLVLRFLQGVAGAGGAVISRAVARDLYSGSNLTRFFALLMIVNGLAPVLAPVMGGQLLYLTTWRGVFMVLALLGAIILTLTLLLLKESLPREQRAEGSLSTTVQAFVRVMTSRRFMGLCLVQGAMMAGMFAYIGASTFVFQKIYHLTAQGFSLCFALNGAGLVVAGQISARLSRNGREPLVLRYGLTVAVILSLVLMVVALVGLPLPFFLAALLLTVACVSAIGTAATSLAMQVHERQVSGMASAVLGVMMFSMGGICLPLSSMAGVSALSMGVTFVCCYAFAWCAHRFVVVPTRR